jgi:hypothetical protein
LPTSEKHDADDDDDDKFVNISIISISITNISTIIVIIIIRIIISISISIIISIIVKIVSRYHPGRMATRAAEATVGKPQSPLERGDSRGRSHSREAAISSGI